MKRGNEGKKKDVTPQGVRPSRGLQVGKKAQIGGGREKIAMFLKKKKGKTFHPLR